MYIHINVMVISAQFAGAPGRGYYLTRSFDKHVKPRQRHTRSLFIREEYISYIYREWRMWRITYVRSIMCVYICIRACAKKECVYIWSEEHKRILKLIINFFAFLLSKSLSVIYKYYLLFIYFFPLYTYVFLYMEKWRRRGRKV